jgi:hypothetical protein
VTTLVFLDTETTSLRPDRRAWEIGLIVRADHDAEHHFFVDAGDLDLGNADLGALRVGRFHARHPHSTGDMAVTIWPEWAALREVERLTRGAHIVGAVPHFDAEVLAARMRANGLCPSWHYHLIDVEALAFGYLAAARAAGEKADLPVLPWSSDELSLALGVAPSEDARHTALGDARWARDLYDAVTEAPEPAPRQCGENR